MKLLRLFIFAAIMTACITLGGCMVGPKYSRPETAASIAKRFFYADANNSDVNDTDRIGRWWENFADDITTRLVTEALENNNDLKAGAARVLQAQAALAEARGRQLPEISYSLNRDRRKLSFDFGAGRSSALITTVEQGFSISYVLDLFGKLRRAKRAAWADMLASESTQDALINTIIASAINSRIEIATLNRRLKIAKANTQSRRKTLDITERRYKLGLVGPADVRLARENLAASQSAQPDIEMSLSKAHYSLDVLLGKKPGFTKKIPDTPAELPDLGPAPVGLPASLLTRRPDVVAAEMSLRSANEQIGISIAQLYPDFTLTGTYGGSADTLRDSFTREAEIYSLIFNLAQPIYKGGQLKAVIKASKAQYKELAANYAQTVLTAMREVEDELSNEHFQAIQMEYVRIRFKEAMAAETLARERYRRGVENLLSVLEAERGRIAAEENLAVLKGRIWTTRVNLFLAIGGDWIAEK